MMCVQKYPQDNGSGRFIDLNLNISNSRRLLLPTYGTVLISHPFRKYVISYYILPYLQQHLSSKSLSL